MWMWSFEMKKNHGMLKHPRLVEFKNSHFYADDFESDFIRFVTARDMLGNVVGEFVHNTNRDWYDKTNPAERITAGEVIKRIYGLCGACMYLDFYIVDMNPSNARDMRIERILTYKLSVSGFYLDYQKKRRKMYSLECADDVKVLNNLQQVMKMEWRT